MPAVALVADVIATATIGETVAAYALDLAGNVIVADAITGAVIGGIGGASGAAAQGQNIWQGAVKGAEAGGISAAIAPAVSSEAESLGATSKVASALGTGAGTTASALATGTPLKQALEYGGISGLVNYAYPVKAGDYAGQVEKGLVTSGLDKLVAPKQAGIGQLGAAPITGQYAKTQTTPGTGALSQALGVGDVGAPVLGGGTDNTSKKNVWNVESLRYMGGGGPSESGYG